MKRRTILKLLFLVFPFTLIAQMKEKKMVSTIHRANERGIAEHGWLHSRFSFSFAEYINFDRMGFGALRVINDDVIQAGTGFGMHPHRDMEIVTILLKGALEHRDSEGNHGVIHPGEIQYMSAGDGVRHSEYALDGEDVELFQIWIRPNQKGGNPLYDQRDFRDFDQTNRWAPLVSGDAKGKSIAIRQDATIYSTVLQEGKKIALESVKAGHGRLVFVIEGKIQIEGESLGARDELQIMDEEEYELFAINDSKVLLFDVPMH